MTTPSDALAEAVRKFLREYKFVPLSQMLPEYRSYAGPGERLAEALFRYDAERAAGAAGDVVSRSRRPGFDVGAGSVKEGDTAMFEGRECKVLTVYHDGDVQIEVKTYPTVKWRFVTPPLSRAE